MRCERILNYYIINILGSHKRNFVPPAQNMLYKVNAKSANTKQQKDTQIKLVATALWHGSVS
jgi:hypothetical protein